MTVTIGRRELLAALGSAAVAWPPAARAQQAGQMPRVGVLMGFGESDAEAQSFLAALRDGLQKLGWNDANARLDIRWGGSEAQRLRAYAADLVALKPDVIVAGATSALAPLKQATQTIPIVFVQVSDPVR